MRFIDSLVRKVAGKMEGGNRCAASQAVTFGAFLALWLGVPLSGLALTVNGSLTADTTWSVSQSPILLQGNVTLDQDALLTIEPGVEIRMEPSASFTLQRGAVRAIGTQSQPIVITSSKANPAPGDWGVWRFTEGTRSAQTQWDHVRVEYGSGIVIEKSSPTLNRVAVRFHNGPAIQTDLDSSPVGQGLSAEGNLLNAISVPAGVVTGQVTWALVGMPYFVESGLVEVGGAQMSIEPAELKLAPSTSWPMRLVLKQPVPAGGRTVRLDTGGTSRVSVPRTVDLPEGSMGVEFTVSTAAVQSPITAMVTAAHPDLGAATAKVYVSNQSILELGSRQTTMLVNSPYTLNVYLSTPAPAGGLAVQLVSNPPGALQHPSTIMVPQGETQAQFIAQGNAPHTSANIAAQAAGYFSRNGISLQFVDQLEVSLDYVSPRTITVGSQNDLPLMPVWPPAPRGGWKVQVTSSDPSVLTVTPGETVVAGEESYPSNAPAVKFTGISLGTAKIQVGGVGVKPSFIDIHVRKPTVLLLESGSANGKLTLGQGLAGKVRVKREIDPNSYHGSSDFWVTLRCEDTSICTGQNVYLPSGASAIEATVTGVAAGATRLIAEAQYATAATLDAKVVKPVLVWQGQWSDDSDSEDSTLWPERYMGARHGFRICLSVPEAAPFNRQKLNGAALVMNLSLPDQIPAGMVSGIYSQESGGTLVSAARIENGGACSDPLFVGEATQRGRYVIGLDMADGTTSRSQYVQVRADHQIEMGAACGDCVELVVVQGFAAKFEVRTAHLGVPLPPNSPVVAQLRCSNAALCTTQATVEIRPDEQTIAEVIGHAPGEASLEATVTNLPAQYPDVGVAKIRVAPPGLSFGGGSWEPPVADAVVGGPQSYEICISEPRWGVRSYPLSDLQVGLSSSNPAVVRPVETTKTWPAGVECIYVDMQILSAGNAQFTVNVPGIPPHSKRFEVQP